MEYKLYYVNAWGQMAYPEGKTVNTKETADYYESYTSIYEARDAAKKVLNKNPLMEAEILFDDMSVTIVADEPIRLKAQNEEYKKQETIGEEVYKQQMRKKYLMYAVYITIAVILYWL